MNTALSPRHAWLLLALTWTGYVLFVAVTRLDDFGLAIEADNLWLWLATRLLTVSFWLGIAATILHARKRPLNWNSPLHAAVATALLAVLLSPSLVSAKASLLTVSGSILTFTLVSATICLTIQRPPVAALLGLLLFPGQLLLDTATHILLRTFPLP
ncbi:MAG: hypothetical protein C0624_09120 [Desulfuromonas sp.]|nr:MAG: hypothetical protein C0624_09120 [Desulfuromonas sp.]